MFKYKSFVISSLKISIYPQVLSQLKKLDKLGSPPPQKKISLKPLLNSEIGFIVSVSYIFFGFTNFRVTVNSFVGKVKNSILELGSYNNLAQLAECPFFLKSLQPSVVCSSGCRLPLILYELLLCYRGYQSCL